MTTNIRTSVEPVYPKWQSKNKLEEYKAFVSDLKVAASIVMKRLGKNFQFVIDDNNRQIILQLFYYITNDKRFLGNHNKGIFLSGNIGTGKTILLMSFLEVMKVHTGKNYFVTYPETVHAVYREKRLDFFKLRPLLIDDICREPEKVEGYWQSESPVKLITQYRYNFACQNYCTGNFGIYSNKVNADGKRNLKEKIVDGKLIPDNEIVKRYGLMIFDRMWEMYNFLELKGDTRR